MEKKNTTGEMIKKWGKSISNVCEEFEKKGMCDYRGDCFVVHFVSYSQ